MIVRRKLWWLMGGVVSVAVSIAACGSSGNGNSSTTGKACSPGDQKTCMCVNSANQTINGTQVCTSDGQGYGTCSCFGLGTGGGNCGDGVIQPSDNCNNPGSE
jgi:hypothetical protein